MRKNDTFKTTVMFSFDDGRRDVYDYAVKELISRKIPATFNIVTSYIEGGREWAGEIEAVPMTVDQLVFLQENRLFEIANHSDSHSNKWSDIQQGKDKLIFYLGIDASEEIGYSSPGSRQSKEWLAEHELHFRKAGYAYVRTGGYWYTKKNCRILFRKISRILHSGLLYAFAYEDTLLDDNERYVLTAVPVMHDITLHQIKSLIRFAEKKRKNCILLLHSILPQAHPEYQDPWVWGAEKFSRLMAFLEQERDEGRIQLLNVKDYALNDRG